MAAVSKTFRVFVSSTFQDLKAERNVLQEQTFHRLLGYCRERGASFQAIDLRWGVSEQASLDQQAMNICLGEIRRCQNITPRPNFFVLLGQRYGWRPPPPQVPADVFERMLQVVSEGERELLGQWYCRDDNSVPPEYILLPRDPEGPYAEHKNWQPVEQALYEAVCTGAKAMGLKGPDLLPWFASATHQEIAAGALSVANPGDKVVCAFREIQDAPVDRQGNPTGGAEAFIDSNQHDIRELKAELKGLIPQRNIRDYTARWSKTAGQPTREYLDGFADDVFAALREQVDRELEDPTPREKREAYCIQPDAALDAEGRAHHEVAEGHLTHFVGRDVILGRIADYMGADEPHPLVISGEGGTGKSALMAKAIEQTQKSQPQAQLVYRFIGATPASSSTRSLLRGLCRELCRRYGGDEAEVPEDHNELSTDFRERLEAVASSAPLALVLDALDQIPEGDLGRTLAWIPNELPEHVRLVVSRRPVQTLDALQSRRPEVLELGGMSPEEGNVLLDTWLDDAGRALQAAQRAEVDQKFAQSESRPLYLRLAFEEARRWPSWQEPETLASGMEGIIRNNLFGRLAHEEHHGPVLISRALSYLAASRYGLAEDEILSVLSRDPEVYAWFLRNTYHLPPDIVACAQHYLHDQGQQIDTNKATAWLEGLRRDEQQLRKVLTEMLAGPKGPHLPVVLWARLLADLEPYLTRRASVTAPLLDFYHRELEDASKKEYLGGSEQELHGRLADYFRGRADPKNDKSWSGADVRGLREMPYHLTSAENWAQLERTLCDLHFIKAKCLAGLSYELISDYDAALEGLPEAHREQRKRTECNLRIERYIRGLLDYARREIEHLEIVPSIEPWSDRQIEQYEQRLTEDPSQLDRVTAFAQFVRLRAHSLAKFAQLPQFVVQESINYAATGPVAARADSIHRESDAGVLLLRPRASRPAYNSHPAPVQQILGHEGTVSSVALAACCSVAVSGGQKDRTIRVWDMRTGKNLWTLEGHERAVTCVTVSAEGTRAVSGGKDGALIVWDLCRGECLRTLAGHMGAVTAASITPCGRTVVSGGEDEVVKVWDIEQGTCSAALQGHNAVVCAVAVKGDGRWAFSVDDCCQILHLGREDPEDRTTEGMNTIRIWDLCQKKCQAALTGSAHVASRHSMAVTPDGRLAVTGINSKEAVLEVWDLARGKSRCMGPGESQMCNGVDITSDGKIAVSADRDGKVRLWRIEEELCFRQLSGHVGPVNSVAISPDGRTALSAGRDGRVLVWDVEKGHSKKAKKPHLGSATITVAPESGSSFISGGEDGTLVVWSADDQGVARPLGRHQRAIRRICVSSEGQVALSSDGDWLGNSDRIARVWNLQRMKLRYELEVCEVIEALGLTPDRKRAVSGDWAGFVRIWSLETGESLHAFQASGRVDCMCILPDGREAISMHGHRVNRWDTETGERLATTWAGGNRWEPDLGEHVTVAPESPHAACLTADGAQLLLASGSDVFLLEPSTGRAILFSGHDWNITSIAITPDGRRGISGSLDGTLRVWDLSTRQCTAVLEHGEKVGALSVSADGSLVLSAGEDGIVKLWELNYAKCIAAYHADAEVTCISRLTPKGTFACGTRSGEVIVLQCDPHLPTIPLVTAVRMWVHGEFEKYGHWTDQYLAFCPHCGQRFAVAQGVVDGIIATHRAASRSGVEAPCATLPVQAWNNPQLCSNCPLCGGALKLNPFAVDNRPAVPWWKFWHRWRQAVGPWPGLRSATIHRKNLP